MVSAERNAVLQAVSAGCTRFSVLAVVTDKPLDAPESSFPDISGESRQFLAEFGDYDIVLVAPDGSRNKRRRIQVSSLLPSQKTRRPSASHNHSRALVTYDGGASTGGNPPRRRPVRDWGVQQVLDWLETSCNLLSYHKAFQDMNVNGTMLMQMTESDLKNMVGLVHPGHRQKVIDGIHVLKKTEMLEHGLEEGGSGASAFNEREMDAENVEMVCKLKLAFDAEASEGGLDAEAVRDALRGLGCEDVPMSKIQERLATLDAEEIGFVDFCFLYNDLFRSSMPLKSATSTTTCQRRHSREAGAERKVQRLDGVPDGR